MSSIYTLKGMCALTVRQFQEPQEQGFIDPSPPNMIRDDPDANTPASSYVGPQQLASTFPASDYLFGGHLRWIGHYFPTFFVDAGQASLNLIRPIKSSSNLPTRSVHRARQNIPRVSPLSCSSLGLGKEDVETALEREEWEEEASKE